MLLVTPPGTRHPERAQDAQRVAVGVEEGAAGVAGNTRGDGEHRRAPAAAAVTFADALLGAEGGDPQAQDGVPRRRRRGRPGGAARAHAVGPAPHRDGGVHVSHV